MIFGGAKLKWLASWLFKVDVFLFVGMNVCRVSCREKRGRGWVLEYESPFFSFFMSFFLFFGKAREPSMKQSTVE